jgi:hypothetical protein
LKRRWKVSIAAMIYRCQDLGIFDDDQLLRLRKQMSYHNYVKHEPLDDVLIPEANSLLPKAFRIIIEQAVKAASEILTDVKLSATAIATLAAADDALLTPVESRPIDISLALRTG